jgi:hypothetical protein
VVEEKRFQMKLRAAQEESQDRVALKVVVGLPNFLKKGLKVETGQVTLVWKLNLLLNILIHGCHMFPAISVALSKRLLSKEVMKLRFSL